MATLSQWLFAFAFTQLIEVPIYRRVLGCGFARAFGASALTHPVVWFVIFPASSLDYTQTAICSEIFAWLAEAAYFAPTFGVRRALSAAFIANAASCLLGLLSRRLFGAP
ncbi:MAG: hypothetical protein RL701_7596 [Pseudomonadota bacterium]|jgi:hypothetical protein